MTTQEIARLIDHAVLHPTQTQEDLEKACALADRWNVATVCVKPCHVYRANTLLSGSQVKVCTVIGFPHGSNTLKMKCAEAEGALRDGASEIDMVINIADALQGNWAALDAEVSALTALCHAEGALIKVIFETDFITDELTKIQLCELCSRLHVDFVKTSTGFGFVKRENGYYSYTGATPEDISLMRKHCAPQVGIKASGGIRTLQDVLTFYNLGATRIGTSSTEAILSG